MEAFKKSHPQLMYQDFLSQTSSVIGIRTDMPPFNDVRVRAAPIAAVSRGLVQWSLLTEQLGAAAKYYQYDPKEARRLLTEAGYPKGFMTTLTVANSLGRDRIDEAVLV